MQTWMVAQDQGSFQPFISIPIASSPAGFIGKQKHEPFGPSAMLSPEERAAKIVLILNYS
jgi:hypothetical protein